MIHSKLLGEYASVFFPNGYYSHSFIETLKELIVAMIIGQQIKVYSIGSEREVASYIHNSPTFRDVNGIYKNLENKVICLPYFPGDESFELPALFLLTNQ